MTEEQKEKLFKEVSGETNILWKVLNKHLTAQTQAFIYGFIIEKIEEFKK